MGPFHPQGGNGHAKAMLLRRPPCGHMDARAEANADTRARRQGRAHARVCVREKTGMMQMMMMMMIIITILTTTATRLT